MLPVGPSDQIADGETGFKTLDTHLADRRYLFTGSATVLALIGIARSVQ
jgi:hypothetical protein